MESTCYASRTGPIISLLDFIIVIYFSSCVTVILFDTHFYKSLSIQPVIAQLLRSFSGPLIYGQFTTENLGDNLQARTLIEQQETLCTNYIIFCQTLEPVAELLGPQPESKVILIPQSLLWQINSFLESAASNQIMNLLIIVDPLLQLDFFTEEKFNPIQDLNMYTHELYATTMGASVPRILSAWRCGRLTRPGTNLFPAKMMNLHGYQLRLAATERPPFVYRKNILHSEPHWDGVEVRLIRLISSQLNCTVRVQQLSQSLGNVEKSIWAELTDKRSDMAAAGIYVTTDTLRQYHASVVHSHDCAVFMTLASTALPKYRAIMGPFQWEVWMTLTLAYLFAILPISFSVHHSLRILLHDPYQLENMFWYVFGTFTNCFTFTGKKSWTSGKMASTRIFIGTYWAFSIIVSAAYSGSIIAFIMLPAFPEVIETPEQLVEEDFKLIVTNNSALKQAIHNSTDAYIQQLSEELTIVESVHQGITNVTRSRFFTHYAFLHSREYLKHVVRTNYTLKSSHKKSKFHLSKNCFVPILVAMMFPKGSVLVTRINDLLMRASQGGFTDKLVNDVAWDQQRSGTGKLLEVSGGVGRELKSGPSEERQLTLDDTQGMFLLMGAGFLIAATSLVAECCMYLWQKRSIKSLNQLPTITFSDKETSAETNKTMFRSQDDFCEYFGSSTNHSLCGLKPLVHTEGTPRHRGLISLSWSAMQFGDRRLNKRSPSV